MQQPQEDEQCLNPIDGAELVLIPAGTFYMGSSEENIETIVQHNPNLDTTWFAQEKAQHIVNLPGFRMYRYPVTVKQYRTYSAATGMRMPAEPEWGWHDDHPIVNVSWDDANRYAAWAGVMLPTEAQWEKAARGDDSRWWPWGNERDMERCANASNASSTCPVTQHPNGASPYGIMEMAGNVWEWCMATPEQYAYVPPRVPQRRQVSPSGRVLRGGSWQCSYDAYFRCAYRCFDCDRQRDHYAYRRPTCGFRCIIPEE